MIKKFKKPLTKFKVATKDKSTEPKPEIKKESDLHKACIVAHMFGFDMQDDFKSLPQTFRNNWKDARTEGFFSDCKSVGDYRRAYWDYISRHD